MSGSERSYKMVLDFGPFMKGIMSMNEVLKSMGMKLRRNKYITTSYAPKLGPGTDI